MEQARFPKRRIGTKLKRSQRTQLTIASIFLLSLGLIFLGSLINEPSTALNNEIDITSENVLELVGVDEKKHSFASVESGEQTNNEIELVYNEFYQTLELHFKNATVYDTELKVYDSLGLLVAYDQINVGVTGLTYKVHELNPGIYTVKAKTEQSMIVEKVSID